MQMWMNDVNYFISQESGDYALYSVTVKDKSQRRKDAVSEFLTVIGIATALSLIVTAIVTGVVFLVSGFHSMITIVTAIVSMLYFIVTEMKTVVSGELDHKYVITAPLGGVSTLTRITPAEPNMAWDKFIQAIYKNSDPEKIRVSAFASVYHNRGFGLESFGFARVWLSDSAMIKEVDSMLKSMPHTLKVIDDKNDVDDYIEDLNTRIRTLYKDSATTRV